MSSATPVFLGIDPGTAITGYGIVSEREGNLFALDYGVIRTSANTNLETRLVTIYDQLNDILNRYHYQAAGVEELFFSKNARTALSVGHARGVVLLTIAQRGLPLYHYKPAQVKQAVAGYGSADKRQIQEMVRLLLGLESIPKPDDAADALAVAICLLHSFRLNTLFQHP
ncbi:MAG: crossover junction endodeoxyribonuclease RuvC [Chloroflexi bacterium]|nr:crossover junction endodeoxyribonuclease RuvC [Chloroflexota bacterium]